MLDDSVAWARDSRAFALAEKYCWWKSSQEALRYPQRIVAAVMDKGTSDDIKVLRTIVGDDELRETLDHAESGQSRAKSWAYWQYRLNHRYGLSLPPLPQRALQ